MVLFVTLHCSNGAIIYDLETKETLIYNKPLVENEIKEIFEIAKKINHAHLYFVDENYVYTNHNPIGKIYYYGYIFNVYWNKT